jgi:EpsI family protein
MINHFRFGATVLLLGATVAVAKFHAPLDAGLARPLESIDSRLDGWVGSEDAPPEARILESLAATAFLSRTYRRGDDSMNVWVAFYANQHAGETMHSPKYCVPGTGWEFVEQHAARVQTDRRSVGINDYVLIRPGDRMRMLYWYQSPKRVVASEYVGKLALMWDAFRYGQTSGSIVRITFADDPAELDHALSFAGAVMAQVDRCFGS